jgi:Putative Actinobacterial Holin-X, holin superfamily III
MATAPEERRRSTLGLVRDLLTSITRLAEDSADLIGASIREELLRFRVELARHALAVVAIVAGAVLLSAGLALFLRDLLGSWPWTLVLFGTLYLVVGFVLSKGSSHESGQT